MSGSSRRPPPPDVCLFFTNARCFGDRGRALLTPGDRARLSASASPHRRLQYEAGRALLRFALQRWTGRPAHSFEMRTAPGGKPECVGGPAISVSHSGDLVVCAVAHAAQVGTDIQFPVPGRNTEAIAERYFSPEENAWLAEDRPARFYMLWVLKEAYLKAAGLGIAGGLDLVTCRVAPPRIDAGVARNGAPAHLALYSTGPGFLAVATLDQRFSEIASELWNPDGPPSSQPPPIEFIASTDVRQSVDSGGGRTPKRA